MTPQEWITAAIRNAPSDRPSAMVIVGGPASGKTHLLGSMRREIGKAPVIIDSDEEPDVEDRADALARARARMYEAIRSRSCIWVNGVSCDPGKAALVLAGLVHARYHVIQVQLDVDIITALSRNRDRLLRGEPRNVPADLFWRADTDLRPAFPHLATLSHVFARFDSDGRLISEGSFTVPGGVDYLQLAADFTSAARAYV